MPNNEFVGDMATTYDHSCAGMFAPEVIEPTVEVLATLAEDGPALEFAIGTGRVALPLQACGVDVHGVELSEDMVARLRAKPGAGTIAVTIGDMATTRVEERFSLVYLVFNTLSNLLHQDEQVDCFRNAAAHLRPGGMFLVELGVPDLRRLPPGQLAVPFDVSEAHLGIDTYDLVAQRLTSHHVIPPTTSSPGVPDTAWSGPATGTRGRPSST